MSNSDTGYAPTRWEFDGEVTRVFDDMLERSIPQYEVMRDMVTRMAGPFIKRSGSFRCVDLGASRGEATARMISAYGALVAYSVAEVSPPMLEVLRERFKKLDQDPGYGFNVKVRAIDLRKDYPVDAACVVLSVLTMCFVPIEHRARVVRSAFDSLRAGGGMIMVEKVLGDTADIDSMLKGIYAAKKKDSGYSDEEIDRKALALEGVLVPLTASGNEDMLRKAGFGQVDCFWRWGNFAGWVAIKG